MDCGEITIKPSSSIELEKCLLLARNESASKLEKNNNELKLQLESVSKRCTILEQKNSIYAQERLDIEKKVAELECSYVELKKDLEECSFKKQKLLESKCDLEISIAESDVYAQVLQENLDEIEGICTTLREQRDEQHHYFLQREVSLKHEFDRQIDKLKNEKAAADQNLSQIKLKEIQLNDELSFFETKEKEWIKEKEKLKKEKESYVLHLKKLENDLKLEKDTVAMVLEKNNHLAAEMLSKKSNYIEPRNHSSSLSKETAFKIEELVNQFYEKKVKSSSDAHERRINELSQQFSECEQKLAEERCLRRDAEMKVENLEDELQKTKRSAESLMRLNVTRCRNSLSRTKPVSRNKLPFNHFKNLLDANHTNAVLDFNVHAITNEDAITGENVTAVANLSPTNVTDDHMLLCLENNVSAGFVPSSKSAERIKRANEKALEKLKKISLL